MTPLLARVRQLACRLRGSLVSLVNPGVRMPGSSLGSGARVVTTMGGLVSAGERCSLANGALVHAEVGSITLGRNVFVGIGAVIVAEEEISIGDDTLIAEYVTIRDQDHCRGGPQPMRSSGFVTAPVRIGRNVWIGAKATITRGVTIGDNAVVGANAVVTRDVAAGSLVGGVPAQPFGRD